MIDMEKPRVEMGFKVKIRIISCGMIHGIVIDGAGNIHATWDRDTGESLCGNKRMNLIKTNIN